MKEVMAVSEDQESLPHLSTPSDSVAVNPLLIPPPSTIPSPPSILAPFEL